MNSSDEIKKKRIEERKLDAVRAGLKAKEISQERFTKESADFINFGLRNSKTERKSKE